MEKESELTEFLTSCEKLTEDSVVWGEMPLEYACYIGSEPPPSRYVSSVRAIVFHDDSVLVIHGDRDQFYITPGGRREKNETLEETLRREVLEETGWTLKGLSMLGFIHFHHLGPEPTNYPYPYPDFIWLIYIAQRDGYIPEYIVYDKYVREAKFCTINELRKLTIEKGELALLDAAIELRHSMR